MVGRDGIGVTDRETTPFSLGSLGSCVVVRNENSRAKRWMGDQERGSGEDETYFWKCLVSRTCWM